MFAFVVLECLSRRYFKVVQYDCLVCGRSAGVQIPDRSNLTQRYKQFATSSTST